MNRRNTLGTAFVVLAVVLFVVPALFPVQPMLTHDTRRNTYDSPEELQRQGIEIVAYENLSRRGQELYVETLERGGEYRVAEGKGAPGFTYPNGTEIRAFYENRSRGETRPGVVVIERPIDGQLPESDEDFFEGREESSELNRTELRRQTLRYDMMTTRKGQPPLGSPPQLLRLGAVVFAVIFLGTGGYLLSSKG